MFLAKGDHRRVIVQYIQLQLDGGTFRSLGKDLRPINIIGAPAIGADFACLHQVLERLPNRHSFFRGVTIVVELIQSMVSVFNRCRDSSQALRIPSGDVSDPVTWRVFRRTQH